MAVVCAACGTENRDAAKFCRGCGARLGEGAVAQNPASWAQTQPSDLPEERTVLVSAPARAASSRTASTPGPADAATAPAAPAASMTPASAPAASRGGWVIGLLVALVLVAGALWGWLGSGRDGAPPPAPAAPVAASPAAVPESPPAAVAPPPAPVELSPLPPAAVVAEPPAAVEATPPPTAPTPAPAAAMPPRPRPTRNALPPPVAAPEPAPAPVASAPPPVAAPVPPPASPQQACANLGFIARSRCLVTECAKPSHARHPQCEAVRQQQQLEDRIRNPDGGA